MHQYVLRVLNFFDFIKIPWICSHNLFGSSFSSFFTIFSKVGRVLAVSMTALRVFVKNTLNKRSSLRNNGVWNFSYFCGSLPKYAVPARYYANVKQTVHFKVSTFLLFKKLSTIPLKSTNNLTRIVFSFFNGDDRRYSKS